MMINESMKNRIYDIISDIEDVIYGNGDVQLSEKDKERAVNRIANLLPQWTVINEDRSNLPEPYLEVLVSYNYGNTATTQTAYFDGDGCFYDAEGVSNWDSKVTAWMYLPEPFRK